MEPKLSACLIVKDEEHHIETCLKSVRPHVDEIVVADTGSHDKTIRLASALADRVLHFRWKNDFSAARNFVISQAANDLVLITDADNSVLSWDETAARRFLETAGPGQTGTVRICDKTHTDGEERITSEDEVKLFDRRYFRYEGIIHEQVVSKDGKPFRRVPAGITISHSGYDLSEADSQRKAARNRTLLKLALKDAPNDAYLLYQLGKSWDAVQDSASALPCYEAALRHVADFNLDYVRRLVIAYGYALVRLGRTKEAADIAQYRPHYGRNPDYAFLLGYIEMLSAHFPQALALYQQCTELTGGDTEGITSFLPLYNIGVMLECLGKKAEALPYYQRCGDYARAKERIAALFHPKDQS